MNLLNEVIKQFKTKDLSNIKYEYTKLDIDKAKLEYLESPDRIDREYTEFLRSQDDIFPVKTDNNLIWLCSYLYLFDKPTLLNELHVIVELVDDLILKGEAFVDNDKCLNWSINDPEFLTARYQDRTVQISALIFQYTNDFEDKVALYVKHNDSDALVMTIAHFIYINVKEGKL